MPDMTFNIDRDAHEDVPCGLRLDIAVYACASTRDRLHVERHMMVGNDSTGRA
jgi:hypothetical protein